LSHCCQVEHEDGTFFVDLLSEDAGHKWREFGDDVADELVGKSVQILWQHPRGWFDATIKNWSWEDDENGKRVRMHEVCWGGVCEAGKRGWVLWAGFHAGPSLHAQAEHADGTYYVDLLSDDAGHQWRNVGENTSDDGDGSDSSADEDGSKGYEAIGQCERNKFCVRGSKHGGKGGHCKIRSEGIARKTSKGCRRGEGVAEGSRSSGKANTVSEKASPPQPKLRTYITEKENETPSMIALQFGVCRLKHISPPPSFPVTSLKIAHVHKSHIYAQQRFYCFRLMSEISFPSTPRSIRKFEPHPSFGAGQSCFCQWILCIGQGATCP
jgi:hypothetical protein